MSISKLLLTFFIYISASSTTVAMEMLPGYMVLINAVCKNDILFVKIILNKEFGDINAVDASGNSALIYAVKKGNKEMVALLLKRGAQVSTKILSIGSDRLNKSLNRLLILLNLEEYSKQPIDWLIDFIEQILSSTIDTKIKTKITNMLGDIIARRDLLALLFEYSVKQEFEYDEEAVTQAMELLAQQNRADY